MLSNRNILIIQFHAAISLMGYWFVQALFTVALGSTTRSISIVYDAFQLCISLYVIIICRKDFYIGKDHSILKAYSIIMMLYALRMVFDMLVGPFVNIVPLSTMLFDFTMTVLHTFTGVWGMISSRNYLSHDSIIKMVYWIGIATVVMVIVNIRLRGAGDIYKEGRMDEGGGLHSLALAKIGSITLLASIHKLLNSKSEKKWMLFIYAGSAILAGWLALASGSRGAVAGLVIGIGFYWVVSSLKNPIIAIFAVASTIIIAINVVPILIWLSDYFPVVSSRMLGTILENDQSGREVLREKAYEIIKSNPIFGYSYRLNADSTGYGSHNGILSVALALGIPICLWFVYNCYIKSVYIALKLARYSSCFFIITFLIFVITSSMSGSSLDDNCFGFAIALSASAYNSRYN